MRRIVIVLFIVLSLFVTGKVNAGSLNSESGTAVESTLGSGTISMSNPSYAGTNNSSYSTVTVGANQRSKGLKVTNWGFNIPASATITGIVVEAKYYTNLATATTGMGVALTKNGSDLYGSSGEILADHSIERYYDLNSGAAGAVSHTNMWGTTWTPAEINASTFGIGYADQVVSAGGSSTLFYVDSFRITVFYTLGTETTDTFYSSSSDGFVESRNAAYATARSGGTLASRANNGNLQIHNSFIASEYYLQEALLEFDTSSIPDSATITGVYLELYGQADGTSPDFMVEARLKDWGGTVDNSDWVAGSSLGSLTRLATFNTLERFKTTRYNRLYEDGTNFRNNINKTGMTRILLNSDRTRIGNSPSASEVIGVYEAEQSGTAQDPQLIVTYLSPSPTVTLDTMGSPSSTSHILKALANPNSLATTGYFRVWEYNPGNCLDGGGVRWPVVGGTGLTGSTNQVFQQTITNLLPNKTYYYCAIAMNAGGTSYHSSTPSSFTTANGPQTDCDVAPNTPITIGGSANCSFPGANNITGADGSGFTLQSGAVLTIQSGQTVIFQTLSKSGATINKIAGGVMRKGYIWVKDADGDGRYDPWTVQFSTSPDTPPDTGYVRRNTLSTASYLSDAYDCNDGTSAVNTPDCKPAGVTPSGITNLTGTTATLNGSANPNGDAGTRAYFKWGSANTGDCDTLASSTSASLITGTTSQGFSQGISGLTGGNTYYWCTVVYNNSGTSYGDISSFVALSAPTGISFSGVSQTNITVNWTPSTGAQGYKIYRCLGAGCSPTAFLANDADNATPHADSAVSCGNTYRYQVTATSGAGGTGNETVKSTISADQSTSSCVSSPTLNSPTATSITGTSATLGGTITSNGGAALNARGTCWSTSDSDPRIGDAGVNCAAEGGTTVAAFSHSRTGLPSSSTIYYTAYATNTSGFTGYTTATSFSTPALLANGSNCSTGSECASGNCYVDADNDRYYPASGTSTCRASTALGNNDCDDTTNTVNPGVTAYSTTPVSSTGPKNGTYDFNCVNGNETNVTALGLWSDYPGSITCKSGSDQGGYNGTLYGAASPNSGSCTYGSSSYNGRICSNVKGTNATCGEYYATGTSATGWWHINSSCWGSSYKKVTGTVGCR